jgi:GGDEF domain-containing protein
MSSTFKSPPSNPTEKGRLEDCLLTLLRGIQEHSVIAEGEEFRAKLAALENRFQGKDNAQLLVDSAVQLLDKYGTKTSEAIARQKSDFAAAAERWATVEEQIKAISTTDDLETVKALLTTQIASARAEALQAATNLESPSSGHVLGDGSATGPAGLTTDPLTGLPTRAYAEAELARALAEPADCFLALFVVKRLALINAKFGYSRGDQVLLKVVVHLAQSLPEYKKLFRWAPCAFLTVAPPKTSYKEFRSKIQIIELTRLTPTLEWEGRSAMVPVVLDCRIVSVKDFGALSDLFLRLDTLAADT